MSAEEEKVNTLWIATTNLGKLKEFERLLAPLQFHVKSLRDAGAYSAPKETGKTFEENAFIKARSLSKVKAGELVVADDSGLEVSGLNNIPGVHSARYAGENASDLQNYTKLLKMVELRTNQNRDARFVCHLCLIDEKGERYDFVGELKGQIAKKATGRNGFGYDPVFVPEGFDKSMAELDDAQKNQISHRSIATQKLLSFLTAKIE